MVIFCCTFHSSIHNFCLCVYVSAVAATIIITSTTTTPPIAAATAAVVANVSRNEKNIFVSGKKTRIIDIFFRAIRITQEPCEFIRVYVCFLLPLQIKIVEKPFEKWPPETMNMTICSKWY